MLGANITFDILRRTESLDSVGGASYSESAVHAGIAGRVGNASTSTRMALQDMGYQTVYAYQIMAQPSDLDVQENDLVLIHGGVFDSTRFVVLLVRKDNILPANSRSHAEIIIQRVITARSTP